MRFLILGHVDRDEISLAAVKSIGKRQCRLRLAHPAGANEQEDADGPPGVREACTRSADPLADRLQGMRLADDAFLELGPQVEDSLDLVGHHLADRNAGPTGDDLGNRLGIDRDLHQRRLSLQLAQLCDLGCQLRLARCQFRRGLKGLAIARMLSSLLGVARLDPAREFADLLDAFPLVFPASLQVSKPGLGLLELVVQLVDSFLVARAGGSFALKDLDLHLEVIDVAPVVFDRGRYAFWPIATRAQAVSIRLTDLSGNCLAGM